MGWDVRVDKKRDGLNLKEWVSQPIVPKRP